MRRALAAVLLLASAACGQQAKRGAGAAAAADSAAADSVRADSVRRAAIIGRDSAFGPTQTIDAKGKVAPIKPPPR